MSHPAPIIFVCATHRRTTVEWSDAEPRFQVLYTTLPDLVLASVRRSNGPGTQEINAVVFDQSIGAREFLDFLSETSCEFRGDVLLLNGDGTGVLSTVSNRDGRHIYQLERQDVFFYASARFGLEANIAAPRFYERFFARTA
ncbi:MAG: hypothetical protein HYU52_16850 [Acidobacteria bacterium]|nr:hypothetical protein [Acidobacteriota bacterium]